MATLVKLSAFSLISGMAASAVAGFVIALPIMLAFGLPPYSLPGLMLALFAGIRSMLAAGWIVAIAGGLLWAIGFRLPRARNRWTWAFAGAAFAVTFLLANAALAFGSHVPNQTEAATLSLMSGAFAIGGIAGALFFRSSMSVFESTWMASGAA